MINEWVLFEKYMKVLGEVGERRVSRVKKKIMSDGLVDINLTPYLVKVFIPLKLSQINLNEVLIAIEGKYDSQSTKAVKMLMQPYKEFYDFS